jgi:hypothetical protein
MAHQPTTSAQPSDWQTRIEGEWHGRPSVFDAQGHHVGFTKVYRSSVFEDGKTTYYMNTRFETDGALRARLEYANFAFGVQDSDRDRIYLGPDFYGSGRPFGAMVDAHYYSPGWMLDLKTMVHILPDAKTQVYSSLLYQGATILCVFNGMYRVAFDYHSNPETRHNIDAFVQTEVANGATPHTLPAKQSGRWSGTLEVYDNAQNKLGTSDVSITHVPLSLLEAEQHVKMTGVLAHEYHFKRRRYGNLHAYEGDIMGNGFGYGRALYTTQHMVGEALRVQGREFIIDDQHTMSVVWQFYRSQTLAQVAFGVLTWEGS